MISVFRIYLGRGWIDNALLSDLLGLLDGVPELLHRVSVLPTEAAHQAGGDAVQRRAAARIAMTQSHVAVLPAGALESGEAWEKHEIHVARCELKRRIPVLCVVPPGGKLAATANQLQPDRIVGWNGPDIACGIQELAEEAQAERRAALMRAGLDNLVLPSRGATRDGTVAQAVRALPAMEIADAWTEFRARRRRGTAN